MQENDSQKKINAAFVAISRRAESVDRETLVQTFVDIGPLFAVLSSHDHQIVYGRRGTGKTHALLYLVEQVKAKGVYPVYLDLRNIGSSGGIYADGNIPVAQRTTRLLMDVLAAIHEGLLDYVISSGSDLAAIGPRLDGFASSITELEVVGETKREVRHSDGEERQHSSSMSATLSASSSVASSISSEARSESKNSSESEVKVAETGQVRYRIHFGSVGKALNDLVAAFKPARLLVVLDEWSTIPIELQPFLADFIRRAVFPVPHITVKIAAIEQRANFMAGTHDDYTGIEIGADASADVDLDDYMVFDNNAERAIEFFKELLFKHYSHEDQPRPEFADADQLVQAAFTQKNAFEDFVQSAEGVPRDAFNVLSLSAQRGMNEKISIPTIRVAARTWFQRDKEGAIKANSEAQDLLHWIIDKVIAHRRARAFLLRSNIRHPLIDALFDARLLHIVKKSISGRDEPGARYDAYKLDYGCYVDLLTTTKAPNKLFEAEDEEGHAEVVNVPVDDYRAIRRAILDLHEFESRAKIQTPGDAK